MKYQLAHYSVIGGRAANEDRVGCVERGRSLLMVAADGLGGHSGGEVASQTLLETVLRVYQNVKHPHIDDPASFLALTIMQAHRAVSARGREHVPPLEARTTCVLCLVQDGYAYWAHVGDSRLYHFRNGRLLTRTQDHTTIEQLHQDGLLSEEEMLTHPRRSYLMQSIGGSTAPTVALGGETVLHPNDVLLLCTDGLWEAYTAEELGTALARPEIEEALEDLLTNTEKKMGQSCDNVSAVCLRWEDRITQSPPLLANRPTALDTRQLYQGAAHKTARRKPAPPAPAITETEPTERNRSIEQRIEEIEAYLRRFEPKK
ncbi:MAG: PP2C family protein-serine/threonine phosphatase [Gammaproteobacteria bacterium]